MPQIFNNAVITKDGANLLTRAQAGECKIKFVKIAVGDGVYSEDEKTLEALQVRTALKSLRNEYKLNDISLYNDFSVKITTLITNQDPITKKTLVESGYYINEMGLYAKKDDADDDTAILYSITTTAGQNGDFMPPYDGYNPAQIIQEYYVTVNNSKEVTIDSSGVYALAEDLITLKKTVDEHIANKLNTHEVTKSQVGLGNVDNTADADKNVASANRLNQLGRLESANVDMTSSTDSHLTLILATNTMTEGKPRLMNGGDTDGFILNLKWDTKTGYGAQLFISNNEPLNIQARTCGKNGWGDWKMLAFNEDTGWTNLEYSNYVSNISGNTPANSIVDVGGNYNHVKIRKVGDRVELKGAISINTGVTNAYGIFYIPAGMIPKTVKYFTQSTNTGKTFRLEIQSAGSDNAGRVAIVMYGVPEDISDAGTFETIPTDARLDINASWFVG